VTDSPRRRIRPLRAHLEGPRTSIDVRAPQPVTPAPLDDGGGDGRAADRAADRDDRASQLREAVWQLRIGGATLNLGERTLMIVGAVLAAVGLVAIAAGWYGAAHSPFLFQQIPYLISGGLLGLALVFLGAISYFAHWLTELVKENRSQSAALLGAIANLEQTIRQQIAGERLERIDRLAGAGSPTAGPAGPNGAIEPELVATARGTMAHRPDCVVVAGKRALRRVSRADGLEPCGMCDPYAPAIPQ